MQKNETIPNQTNGKEIWETPQLRILPVPLKTQNGIHNQASQEDNFFYFIS